MNSNLGFLLKIEFQKFLSSFRSKNKKKVSQMPLFYVALLMGFLLILSSAGYSFLIIYPYISTDSDPTPAISLFAGLASMLTFMTTMNQARSIYTGDDYDMLNALPIKKRDIVSSKIISMYIFELLFSLIIMVPHGIVMIILTKNVSLLLISFLLAFTLPIVPIAFAVLLSILVTMLTARFKSANMVFTILYTLIIVAISGMSMFINNMRDEQAVSSFSTMGNILKWINPSYAFVELALGSNMLFILVYVGINLLVAILSIAFIALAFDRLHEIVSSVSMKKKYVRKDLKNKSEGKLLLSLEFKRLVNSKFYFANTVMGSIMAVLGSTVFIISFTQAFSSVTDETALYIMKAMLVPMYIAIVAMIVGLVNPTTGSINIEGKNFWIIKSLPIDHKKYLRAKLLFSWILTLPACLIASSVTIIFYHENVIDIIFAYLIPLIYSVLNSLIGLIIALHYPHLKWNSEQEAVKSSKAVTICLFINLGMASAIGTPLIVLSAILPNFIWIAYVATTVSLIIPLIPCAIYLNKHFGDRIRLIEEF